MTKPDIQQEITDNIIDLLETVSLHDYEAPFASLASQGIPLNPISENHYNGINILNLWFYQGKRSFTSNHWATFKQWKEKGASVKKGEKGSRIVFYKTLEITGDNGQGQEETNKIPMLRQYSVFNANQVEGYDHTDMDETANRDEVKRITLADQFCEQTKADIRHGEARAYYQRVEDFINMPESKAFKDTSNATATENYYSTLFHELTHWTGAPHRLEREKGKVQGDNKYAFEELIAELGAAFLCAKFNIAQSRRDDHAIYLKSWLQALKNDKSHIFKAAAQASKATEFLNDLQPD